ncbi:MAG: DUF2933 domain-containing protein [Thermoanaerobaculia bacterium]
MKASKSIPAAPSEGEARGLGERRAVMQWLVANWPWVLFGIAFVAMHLFGHGSHGGHGGGNPQPPATESAQGEAQRRVVNTPGHNH